MLKSKRAQVTVEFIASLAIVSLIFLITLNFIANERRITAQVIWSLDAQDAAQKLAHGIDYVYIAGDGTDMNVTLPKKLVGGVQYTVFVRPRIVIVNVTPYDREFEWKFMTSDIGDMGEAMALTPGTINVENVNGTIYLTEYA
ncbi:MAG: hypothetical protein V1744_07605 [Candidatus Altiarchaeota archaeon]